MDNSRDQAQPFSNLQIFFTQRVPSRTWYIEKARTHGAIITRNEQLADHIIADHRRKDGPPGSISYTWIDASIEAGTAVDTLVHLAGPAHGSIRPVGSARPTKTGQRHPFTAEDDRILHEWVMRYLEQGGGATAGNEIYKQLEETNQRHTWQSWRDRYQKYVSRDPRYKVDVERFAAEAFQPQSNDGQLIVPTHIPPPPRSEALQSRSPETMRAYSVETTLPNPTRQPSREELTRPIRRFRPPQMIDLTLDDDDAPPSTAPAKMAAAQRPFVKRESPPATQPVPSAAHPSHSKRKKRHDANAVSNHQADHVHSGGEPRAVDRTDRIVRLQSGVQSNKRRKQSAPELPFSEDAKAEEIPTSLRAEDSMPTLVGNRTMSQLELSTPEPVILQSNDGRIESRLFAPHESESYPIERGVDFEPSSELRSQEFHAGKGSKEAESPVVSRQELIILPNASSQTSPIFNNASNRLSAQITTPASQQLTSAGLARYQTPIQPTSHLFEELARFDSSHTPDQWRKFWQERFGDANQLSGVVEDPQPAASNVLSQPDHEQELTSADRDFLLVNAKELYDIYTSRWDETHENRFEQIFPELARITGKGTAAAWHRLWVDITPTLQRTNDCIIRDGGEQDTFIPPTHVSRHSGGSVSLATAEPIVLSQTSQILRGAPSHVNGDTVKTADSARDAKETELRSFNIHQDNTGAEEATPELEQENPGFMSEAQSPSRSRRHNLGPDEALQAFRQQPVDFRLVDVTSRSQGSVASSTSSHPATSDNLQSSAVDLNANETIDTNTDNMKSTTLRNRNARDHTQAQFHTAFQQQSQDGSISIEGNESFHSAAESSPPHRSSESNEPRQDRESQELRHIDPDYDVPQPVSQADSNGDPDPNLSPRLAPALDFQSSAGSQLHLSNAPVRIPSLSESSRSASSTSQSRSRPARDVAASVVKSSQEMKSQSNSHTASQSVSQIQPQSQSQTESQSFGDKDTDAFIEQLQKEGYEHTEIVEAIFRTSMDPLLVRMILSHEKSSVSSLNHVPGIWRDEDDEMLRSDSSHVMLELESFHGRRRVTARKECLRIWGLL